MLEFLVCFCWFERIILGKNKKNFANDFELSVCFVVNKVSPAPNHGQSLEAPAEPKPENFQKTTDMATKP